MKNFARYTLLIVLALLVNVSFSYAGSLTPPGSASKTMYTLENIFGKLTDFTATSTEGGGSFATPGSVSASMHSLLDIYGLLEDEEADLIPGNIANGVSIFGVTGTLSGGGGAAGLPKTMQTTCWDDAGSPISCAGTGQDGEYQKNLPTSGARFTDNADGTISDNGTGLMWKKCNEGQSGTDCTIPHPWATPYDWTPALAVCEADTTAGHTDWRLPNQMELISLLDYSITDSFANLIDPTFFPNAGRDVWSSTSLASSPTRAWWVGFGGYTDWSAKNGGNYVRCVR